MKSSKKNDTKKIVQGTSRRSFLQTAMAGGALASTAYLGLTRDVFAKETGYRRQIINFGGDEKSVFSYG